MATTMAHRDSRIMSTLESILNDVDEHYSAHCTHRRRSSSRPSWTAPYPRCTAQSPPVSLRNWQEGQAAGRPSATSLACTPHRAPRLADHTDRGWTSMYRSGETRDQVYSRTAQRPLAPRSRVGLRCPVLVFGKQRIKRSLSRSRKEVVCRDRVPHLDPGERPALEGLSHDQVAVLAPLADICLAGHAAYDRARSRKYKPRNQKQQHS